MTVYIVIGQVYDENSDCFENRLINVFQNEDEAILNAAQHETTDQMDGYLSNFYWVEPWEVQ